MSVLHTGTGATPVTLVGVYESAHIIPRKSHQLTLKVLQQVIINN